MDSPAPSENCVSHFSGRDWRMSFESYLTGEKELRLCFEFLAICIKITEFWDLWNFKITQGDDSTQCTYPHHIRSFLCTASPMSRGVLIFWKSFEQELNTAKNRVVFVNCHTAPSVMWHLLWLPPSDYKTINVGWYWIVWATLYQIFCVPISIVLGGMD